MEPLGHGLFTTEILNDAADTLERFDQYRSDGGDGVPLFFEPPSLDDRIVNPDFTHGVRRNRERELIQYEMNSTSSPTRSSG